MKNWTKYIVIVFFISVFIGSVSNLNADLTAISAEVPEVTEVEGQDTTPLRFPVAPIITESYEDLGNHHPIDLRNPQNFPNGFEYNPLTNRYELRSVLGGSDITTPISLTQEEYLDYTFQQSMNSYFRTRNDEIFKQEGEGENGDILDMFDFNFDLGPAEKIFGPGGVRLKAQGGINIKTSVSRTSTDNPTLSERQRNRTSFDFDAQVNANIAASVGDKLNFDLNYNTESTFDFDTKKLKLAYTGKEDEIIKVLEAGNVSMNTSNSLIRGGAALFGIKTQLQFGKLTVDAIFSQQESQSRTTSSKGNVQTTPFEIKVDNYDQNMHFFIGHYFRDTYDESLSSLPYIKSGVSIERMELWVTNKRGNYNQARNIVAFADLGEHDSISVPSFVRPIGEDKIPSNKSNTLYSSLLESYPGARNISSVNQVLSGTGMDSGRDYEKIENARKLESNEYTYNSQLGYISLRSQLQSDETLAIAFEYSYRGEVYQVGEFSTDNPNNSTDNIYVKLLKGTSISPSSPTWDLMMKNVYSISNRSITSDNFRLDIKYQNDTTGVYLSYITEGPIANEPLLRVMNVDRLDSRQEAYPDGFYDYVEGYTVFSQTGKIMFPVVEPFGKHLRKKIGDDAIADKYVFEELYDSTLTVARQTAEKNKFLLQGEYKGSGSSNIELDGFNVTRGSVTVTANGVKLIENVDYSVDYSSGNVTVINPAYENANIQVSSEDRSAFGMQRKTMMGLNLNYAFSPTFNIGATIMNLSEMPLTLKSNPGEESINNTLFGFNTNYSTQSQWLTNMLDKLPFVELTAPSQITLSAEYAQLIPGHYENEDGGNYSYIDDFERAKMEIDLRSPYLWNLSSTPSYFPEWKKTNQLDYGNNRALLAWYTIDNLFTRKSSLTPSHIKNDLVQLSNHYVREITEYELFPNKEQRHNESATIPVFNLAFYPKERGPYNVDADGMNADGTLSNPEGRWGGIYRKMESGQTDFEANNIEHIEFWLLDPFIYEPNSRGGDLYFDLGDISEDILKDEKKFYENGMPINGDRSQVEETVWGLVPKQQSLVYAFDNTEGARKMQDVGLNGLTSEEEKTFPTYANYLSQLENKLDPTTLQAMREDPFSPFNDPAGDNYHYFRGSDYDRDQVSILGRYKRYNGTEGNSVDSKDSPESYSTAAKLGPDVEDINQDNTLNESEKYFQYKVSIAPGDLKVGHNFIVDKREVKPSLKDGSDKTVTWYQFKIPISNYTKKEGDVDLSSIRFMRMFLTNFSDSTVLRFGTLQLVRGDWRVYTKDLNNPNLPASENALISVSTVNLEENGDKVPVNYVMPPGVSRVIDPGQQQVTMQNEQSLAINVSNLSPGDARAVYKNTGLDARQYKRLQMFAHAEQLKDDVSNLQDGELSVFLRLGSDYKNNYYEYEIPLSVTPPGNYFSNNDSDRRTVWPDENMFDFPFSILTDLKLARNKEKNKENSTVNYYTPYSSFDPNKPMNKVTVIGNPTISEIKVIMVGIRNNSNSDKSAEIWVDEMRLGEFNEDGGWAGNMNLYLALSDLGTVNFSGRKETAGFGSLDQGIADRSLDDSYAYSIATQIEVGKFFPEKAKVSLPVYFSYSEEVVSPKYNPLDQDILLKDALDAVETKAEKDSIKSFAQDKVTSKSLDINNVRVNITSKKPMPYDPANFTLGYSHSENKVTNATTEYETQTNTRFVFNYNYSPMTKPWQPFNSKKTKTNSWNKFFKEIGIGYLPKNISVTSDIYRNYYELQQRDINSESRISLPVSFREDFYWDRTFSIQWDLTRNLNLTLNTGTDARIDAPHVQVNKKFNSDDYSLWKDSVMQSIQDWGTPMNYNQRFAARYNIPFKNIPILNFITAGLSYTATYDWERGATIEGDEVEVGNVIKNSRTIGLENATFNFNNLYSKFKFLDDANKKYTLKRNTQTNNKNNRNRNNNTANKKVNQNQNKKKFEREVTLNMDSATVVRHSLNNKRVRVTARGADGKLYDIKFKKVDANSIAIKNKDTAQVKLTITQLPPLEDEKWYKIAQIGARGLMLIRNVGFSYTETSGMSLPGFRPEIGDFFGQGSTAYGNAPGLDFAFGFTDESYINKAKDKGWLIEDNEDNINPATFNKTEMFNFTALLEPFVGMKINLTATRSSSHRNQIYYMYNDMPTRFSGDFNITTIALSSAFEKSNAENGYYSKSFEKFLENRQIIAERLERAYSGSRYPSSGFLSGTPHAGETYNPENGSVNLNSADVLVPAFLAAYTGRDAGSSSLSFFPALKSILPNWRLSYEGFIQIPLINKYFKTFVLEHEYKCRYAVGAYSSYSNWVGLDGSDGLGFIRSVTTDNPTPSSAYDITAVSIAESFDPLIRLNSVFLNNMSLKLEYKTSRNLNLNISSYQIVESNTEDFGFGLGYRFENFHKTLRLPKTGGDSFNNEFKMSATITYRKSQRLIRKIEEAYTQATSGDSQTLLNLTADYNLSRLVTLQAFFDKQISKPLVSSSSFPVSKTNFGFNLRISLTR